LPRDPIEEPDVEPALGRGRRVQKKPPGAYKNEWLMLCHLSKPIFVSLADPDDDDIGIYLPEDDDDMFAMLPP